MTGIRICSAPGDWAKGGNTKYLKHLCTTKNGSEQRIPDIVAVTEAKDYLLHDALKEAGLSNWRAVQFKVNAAHMGCAFAVHSTVEIAAMGQTVGARPFIGKHHIQMLTRYQTWIRVKYQGRSYFLDDIHTPPKRFGILQPGYIDRVHATCAGHPHAVVLGDFNMPVADMAKALGMRVVAGSGITGIVGRDLGYSDVVINRWGQVNNVTDHYASYVTVTP